MPEWIEDALPFLLFVAAPAANGVFLAIGLTAGRAEPVPRSWRALLIAACTAPAVILALGFALQADHPVRYRERTEWRSLSESVLFGWGVLAGLVGPLALIQATATLSVRRSAGWLIGLVTACLTLIPLTLLALLGAAQMVSGVPL